MNVTKKFIGICLASVMAIGMIGIIVNPIISFSLVNLVLVGLLLSDYMLTHREIKLEIVRTGEDKLSINEKEKISFSVYNKGRLKVEAELIDELPDYHFEVYQPQVSLSAASGEKVVVSYEVIPRKRGAFDFGNVHVRIKSRMGLYEEYRLFPLKREYKVYPNLHSLKKYRMNIYKNMLEREERKAVKLRTQGTAFESLKEYVAGDEYRKINWPASARSDKLIVNQYEPEKNQRIYAMIDAGRAMSYTLRGECRLDQAINTTLVLSDMVTRNGDLAGLMCFNEKVIGQVMPGKGSQHRDKLMETLYHIQSTNATSNYEDAFLYFRQKERRKSIIFLFTDFDTFEEAELIAKAASIIERQHILVIVLIKNLDMEAIAVKEAVRENEIYEKAVAIDLLEERRRSIARLNRIGVMCIETEPEKLTMTVVSRYIEIKSRLGI